MLQFNANPVWLAPVPRTPPAVCAVERWARFSDAADEARGVPFFQHAFLACGMLPHVNVLEVYKEVGGYLEGHFLLASGRHSPKFLQSTTVLQYPDKAERIGKALAAKFGTSPDFVIGPAMGGVVLAFVVAKALSCRALFAEKDGGGGMKIREAFSVKPGETFVAVEDVVTTGGSLQKAIQAVESCGASLVGTACIIDRRDDEARVAVPIRSLTRLEFPTYNPDACPLCDAGLPLEHV